MATYNYEWTDTFGGEANYCWVERGTVEASSMRQAITKAKQARYYAPMPRHTLSDFGDMARIDIVGDAVCCFVTCA